MFNAKIMDLTDCENLFIFQIHLISCHRQFTIFEMGMKTICKAIDTKLFVINKGTKDLYNMVPKYPCFKV